MTDHRFEDHVISEADFSEQRFSQEVAFIRCSFPSNASFRKCTFEGNLTFENCQFQNDLDFTEVTVRGLFEVTSEFRGTALFDRSVFHGGVKFLSAHFYKDAYFRFVDFKWDFSLAASRFDARLNLRGSQFGGYADLSDVICQGRVKLLDAIFQDEVRLQNAQFRYLKNLAADGVSLDGAVLREAHFHGISTLNGYSFRNAFLLSCSLADKTLIDCDFTGAVVKAVLVDGWNPDIRTLRNTKYIYTDYETETVEYNGQLTTHLIPRQESRVPLIGEFGSGEHLSFTLASFLNTRSDWQISVELPEGIRTAVLNYLNFFPEFIRATEDSDVELRSRREGGRLRLEFVSLSSIDLDVLKMRLEQYLENVGKPALIALQFKTEKDAGTERDLFLIRYEHQMNTLRTELKYVERLLSKEEEKNRQLLDLVDRIGRNPQQVLLPPKYERFEVDVYFLTADLQGYSNATRLDKQLYAPIQQFLLDLRQEILAESHCELVKLEGDSIKVFSRDGVAMIWLARKIIHEFEALKRKTPIGIEGFRAILGQGHCIKDIRPDGPDFAGDCIIDTVRIDQPMKAYLKLNHLPANQIWCTEAFHDAIQGRHSNISFERLPPIVLDKGHASAGDLFSVSIT